jgi:flavin-dependent dehydrogenase
VRLEAVLLDRAVEEGARVRRAAAVTRVVLGDRPGDGATLRVSLPDDGPATWRARTVVGADGPRSIVARAAGVDRVARRFRRAGLTVHHHDPAAPPGVGPAVARMTVGPGWYCGVAPVPGGRVNVGVVVGEATLRGVAGDGGPDALVRRVVDALPGEREPWRDAERTDELMVALPLAHRPARLAGPGWLLVGDAAGFIDPLSGEGITRALASAALAAGALSGAVPGVRLDAAGYDRAMRARFRGKDALSLLLQGFLAWPAAAGYALDRLDRRPALREAFGRVLSDLDPASRALDPRFLARVLAP